MKGKKRWQKFLQTVFPACEDGQGRVVLPEKLREYAGIDKDVVSIGMGDHVDIYSKAEREKLKSENAYGKIMDILKGKTE